VPLLVRAWPIFAALLFNLLLCFVNTKLGVVKPAFVMLAELLIIVAALGMILERLPASLVVFLLGFGGYLLLLMVFGQGIDLKLGRDILIPIVFLFYGAAYLEEGECAKVAKWAGSLVLAFAVFEWTLLDTFLANFNIMQYYVARGTVTQEFGEHLGYQLSVNGLRPEGDGRALLSFLGPHRVGSVFLEPVSSANFGSLIYLAAISGFTRPRRAFVLALIGLAIIVAADGRFAMLTCVILTAVRLVPAARDVRVLAVLPIVAIAALLGIVFVAGDTQIDNGFVGRLYHSGELLASLSLAQWFGLDAVKYGLFDSGYGYVINKFGIIGAVVLWTMFLLIPARTERAQIFRGGLAYYICLSLCISQSMFTIKSAGFVWAVMGALAFAGTRRATADAERRDRGAVVPVRTRPQPV
jgi:putative polymerase